MLASIETLLASVPPSVLKQAAETLSERYREGQHPYLTEESHYLAYLAVRFPATYQVITNVFQSINPSGVHSLLDLGAGPGTGYLAAQDFFSLSQATLIEADPGFIRIGKRILPKEVTWNQNTLPCTLPPHDLVLMSYSLGEMIDPNKVVDAAWQATKQYLVIIEPGTPKGYQQLIEVRDRLLKAGAFMVAPCPNALRCPMKGNDWCHFPARVERNRLHRYLKSGTLGFEDEKYSYMIFAKKEHSLAHARIIAPVTYKKGQVLLPLCQEGRIEMSIVTSKDKEFYKSCRKKSWGDSI